LNSNLYVFITLTHPVICRRFKAGCNVFNAGCIEQVFSIQVVLNKCFVLYLEKNDADPSYRFQENAKITHFNSEKITSPSRRLGYYDNQLNC